MNEIPNMSQSDTDNIIKLAAIFNIDMDILEKEETLHGLRIAIFDILFLKQNKKNNKKKMTEKLLPRYGYNVAIVDYISNAVIKMHKEKKLHFDLKKSLLDIFKSSGLVLQRFIEGTLMNLSLEKNGHQIFSSDNLVIERDWIEQTSLQPISAIAIGINTSASFGINLLNHNCYVGSKQIEQIDIARFEKKKDNDHSFLFILQVKYSNEIFMNLSFSEELSIKENVDMSNFQDKLKEELVEVLSKTFIIYNHVFFDFLD